MQLLEGVIGLSLAEMQEHPSLIINAFDRHHTVLFWNDRCAAHFKISAKEAIGKKLEEILPWTKTDEKLLYIDRALLGKNMQILNIPYRLKHGSYEQQVYAVRNEAGKVVAALNVIQDVMAPAVAEL